MDWSVTFILLCCPIVVTPPNSPSWNRKESVTNVMGRCWSLESGCCFGLLPCGGLEKTRKSSKEHESTLSEGDVSNLSSLTAFTFPVVYYDYQQNFAEQSKIWTILVFGRKNLKLVVFSSVFFLLFIKYWLVGKKCQILEMQMFC